MTIQDALEAYETAPNGSDVDKVLDVFAPDGVFMAPNNPSAVGTGAIRGAYGGIFKAIAFDTELTVAEVAQVAPECSSGRSSR